MGYYFYYIVNRKVKYGLLFLLLLSLSMFFSFVFNVFLMFFCRLCNLTYG